VALAYVSEAQGSTDSSVTTLDCTSSLNVADGDLLVAVVTWEGNDTTVGVAKNSGSPANAFTFNVADKIAQTGNINLAIGYVLAAAADSSATFRVTFGAARGYCSLWVAQYRPGTGTIAVRDTGSTGSGSGTSAATGTIATTGTDAVVVAGVKTDTGASSVSNARINSVAADHTWDGTGLAVEAAWDRILSAAMSGTASVTIPSANWVICGVAFKAITPADVSFVGTSSGLTTTVSAPAGIQTGDLMLVTAVGPAVPTIPGGWTQIGTSKSGGGWYGIAAYRIRRSGDSTYSGWTNAAGWTLGAYRNVTTGDPLVASDFSFYSGTSIPLPSLTASPIAGDGAVYNITGLGSSTYTVTTYAEELDTGASQTVGDRLGLTANQSTSGTVTASPTDSSWVLHVIARSTNTGGGGGGRKWLLGAH